MNDMQQTAAEIARVALWAARGNILQAHADLEEAAKVNPGLVTKLIAHVLAEVAARPVVLPGGGEEL